MLNNSLSLNNNGIVYIPKGSSKTSTFNLLYDKGYVYDKLAFSILSKITFSDIKSGEYSINNESPLTILLKIDKHDIIYRKFVIIEGTTIKQVRKKMLNNKYLTGVAKLNDNELIFANTYNFERGENVNNLIKNIKEHFLIKSEEIWQKRQNNLPIKNINQAYTLASIIEKETGLVNEREKVASVFINRLNKNMKLQSDPTVIYAISDGWGNIDRELTKKDLLYPSLYNTYYTRGLPPNPIAIVGEESFYSALNPENTKLLYFVADGKGGHNFAKTLKQHNKNVKIYRKSKQQ
ncbi:MAG: endolytic transglycosylase MltG [Alphaproteobacteria bacterium]|nr:endolytic transglycosylase MltG [Alphaproteobacteria bacterium]